MNMSRLLGVAVLAATCGAGPTTRPLLYEVRSGGIDGSSRSRATTYDLRLRMPGLDAQTVAETFEGWLTHQRWRADADSTTVYFAVPQRARYFDGDFFVVLEIRSDDGGDAPTEAQVQPLAERIREMATTTNGRSAADREAAAQAFRSDQAQLEQTYEKNGELEEFDQKAYDEMRGSVDGIDGRIEGKKERSDALEKVIGEARAKAKAELEADPAVIELKRNVAMAEKALADAVGAGTSHPAVLEGNVQSARAQLAAREAAVAREGSGAAIGKLTEEKAAVDVDREELALQRQRVFAEVQRRYQVGVTAAELTRRTWELKQKIASDRERLMLGAVEEVVKLERSGTGEANAGR